MIKQGGEICLLFMFSSQWLEAIYSRNPEKDGNGCVSCAQLSAALCSARSPLAHLISTPTPSTGFCTLFRNTKYASNYEGFHLLVPSSRSCSSLGFNSNPSFSAVDFLLV